MTVILIALLIVLYSSCLLVLTLKGTIVFRSVVPIMIYSFVWASSLVIFLYSSGVLEALMKACGKQ